ncbi:MAG TPA: LmbE family protein, partial [Saprospiraceae bacterium]|nr:LmbE family protein [Saprospiraceae bacterium]
DHRIFNMPNKLTNADFEAWVQERGLYFITTDDTRYQKLLKTHDPGEQDLDGSLVTCKYGNGNFVYCSLSLFRQLPVGVPGAYKLLANMLSLGVQQN